MEPVTIAYIFFGTLWVVGAILPICRLIETKCFKN